MDDGVTGFLIRERDSQDLIKKISKFIEMDYQARRQMGLEGRRKVETQFNRQFVVNAYVKEIKEILE